MGAASRRALDVPSRLGLALLPACWPWGPGAPPSHPQLFLRPPSVPAQTSCRPGTSAQSLSGPVGRLLSPERRPQVGCGTSRRLFFSECEGFRVQKGWSGRTCGCLLPPGSSGPRSGTAGRPACRVAAGPSGASVSVLFCGQISSRLNKKTQTWLSWT